VEIQKGDTIEADIFSLGRNEDIWGADANEFHPER
jgi:cytochrome P450